MRTDGRTANQLRPVRMTRDFVKYPEGSVLIEVGETRVLCNATVQPDVPKWMAGQGRGWVTAEYSMLPRATQVRTPRETNGLGARTQEIRRLIGRALRASVHLNLLGERSFIIDCDVLQADGGTRTAAVTGGYVALALALQRLIERGEIPRRTLRSPVAAVSVGVIDGEPRLDLSYVEDSAAEVDFNVVTNAQHEFIEVQGTAEGRPFSRKTLDHLLVLAESGITELLRLQAEIVR